MITRNEFIVKTYEISSKRLTRDVTALLVGDLHSNEFGRENRTLLAACADIRPDFILCTGDMGISAEGAPTRVETAFLRKLNDIAQVYAVNGNHETAVRRDPPRYEAYLQNTVESGTALLNNRSCRAIIKGQKFRMTGLELRPVKYRKLVRPHFTLAEIEADVGRRYDGAFQILLVHNPQFAPQYFKWGADLTVCGHFHGGVMRLPGGRCLVSPYGFPFPKYGYGHFEKDGAHIIVTSGLGEHKIPFRIHNPMELVRINLRAAR